MQDVIMLQAGENYNPGKRTIFTTVALKSNESCELYLYYPFKVEKVEDLSHTLLEKDHWLNILTAQTRDFIAGKFVGITLPNKSTEEYVPLDIKKYENWPFEDKDFMKFINDRKSVVPFTRIKPKNKSYKRQILRFVFEIENDISYTAQPYTKFEFLGPLQVRETIDSRYHEAHSELRNSFLEKLKFIQMGPHITIYDFILGVPNYCDMRIVTGNEYKCKKNPLVNTYWVGNMEVRDEYKNRIFADFFTTDKDNFLIVCTIMRRKGNV